MKEGGFTFRPARRERTPLTIGMSGPTKSGKTVSSLRLATGLARGGSVIMLNTEGARGRQYADQFAYQVADVEPPYTLATLTEGVKAIRLEKPAVAIIDSMSPFHEGPGGFLEQHEAVLDRLAGKDYKKRERFNFTAWAEPRREFQAFIYAMLELDCHVILCMKAKDKLQKLKKGEEVEFRWEPIATEGLDYETIFTLMFLPRANGVPTLELSDLRMPFDKMIQRDRQIDEHLGEALAAWSDGPTREPDPIELEAHDVARTILEAPTLALAKEAYIPAYNKHERQNHFYGPHWQIIEDARATRKARG